MSTISKQQNSPVVNQELLQTLQQEIGQAAQESRDSLQRVEHLQELIANAIRSGTIEVSELIDWQQQYEEAVATLEKFNLLPESVPSLETVHGSFSPNKILALAALRHEPKLHLVSNVSFARKVNAINKSGLTKSPTWINEDVFGSMEMSDVSEQTTSLQPVFIESTQDMPKAEGNDDTLENRINAAKLKRVKGQDGTDRHTYATLMMDSLRREEPVDQKTWTVLDSDEAYEGNTVPGGGFSLERGEVYFDANHADRVVGFARLRASVGGDVLEC